jgi:hypothetical protein
MNLNDLHGFVQITRKKEGCSWYLVDSTPGTGSGEVYRLNVFDEEGTLSHEIREIEEEVDGQIKPEKLREVAAARAFAGTTPKFLRDEGEDGPEKFERFRAAWLKGGLSEFLSQHGLSADADANQAET